MIQKVIIVNDKDEEIGVKNRSEITSSDLYRVSALWIFNSQNDILLAQRALSKTNDPGKWGPAAAGTVEVGETYENNIIKEAEEELGLQNIAPLALEKVFSKDYKHPHFTKRFGLIIDKPAEDFTIQQEEVAQIKWFSQAELSKALADHPEDFLKSVNDWERIFNLLS